MEPAIGHLPPVPVQHLDRSLGFSLDVEFDDRRCVGPRNAGQQHIDQPDEQLGIVHRPGNHFRQSGQHVEPLIRIAKSHSPQILRAERLLFDRLIVRVAPFGSIVGQDEGRVADHEMLARLYLEFVRFLAGQKNRVEPRGQAFDS